jgi:hyperosmotically inducible protein
MTSGDRRVAFLLVLSLVLPLVAFACGKTIGETMDDATITTRVKTALLNDPDVNATRIDVSTAAGMVTLSGEVRSKNEAECAVQVARTVQGVKDVRSALKIGS